MKKLSTLNPAVYAVVIFAMALLLGSGIIAGLEKSALLSVSAGENAGVSDGDMSSENRDIVSPGEKKSKTVFVKGAAPIRAYADPALASFPFTTRHLLQMDDGTTVTTVPAETALTDGTVYNLSSGSALNTISVPRTDEVTTGTLYQGIDMEMYFHGGLSNKSTANVKDLTGEVKLHLSDGSEIEWSCQNARYTTVNNLYKHYFTFKWDDVQTVLDEKSASVTSMDINVIYGIKAPITFELIRHDSDAAIRLESLNPDNISGRLFNSEVYERNKNISGDKSVSVDDMKTGMSSMEFSGTDATLSGGAMADERFYLYDSGSGHSIKSVTARIGSSDATSECISYDSDSERYIVKMKNNLIINVNSEPQTVHKVTVKGTSDDFSLYSVAVADRFDSGTKDWYSNEARNMRYANQSCTDVLTNGNFYKRVKDNGFTSSDGKTVSFVNYHVNNNVNWYMSLIAYGTIPDSSLSVNSANDQFTAIYDVVITRDSDGTDVTDHQHRRRYQDQEV